MLRAFCSTRWITRRFCTTLVAANAESTLFSPSEYNYFHPYLDAGPQGRSQEFHALWRQIEESKKGVVEVVQQWKPAEALKQELMRSILLKLCSCAWFAEARKLAFWVDKQRLFELSDSDLVLRVEALCRSGHWNVARRHFDKLSLKTEEAYLTLLEAFNGQVLTEDVLSLVNELKKSNVPPSARVYAALIRLYARLGLNDKALRYFNKFQASGVDMDASMCWALLAHKDVFPEEMRVRDKVEAALSGLKLDGSNRMHLLRVNAALGNADEVCRVWKEMKKMSPPATLLEWISASNALKIVGEASKAQAVISELVSRTSTMSYHHKLKLLKMYARNGLMQEAECLQVSLMKQKLNFELCQPLVDGYLRLNKLDAALKSFYAFLSWGQDAARQPQEMVADTMTKFIRTEFCKRGDVEAAEKMLARVPETREASVYHALIQTYIAGNNPGHGLESRLCAANIVKDRKADSLMRLLRTKFPLQPPPVQIDVDSLNRPIRIKHLTEVYEAPRLRRFGNKPQVGRERKREVKHVWLPWELFRKNKKRRRQAEAQADAWSFFRTKAGKDVRSF